MDIKIITKAIKLAATEELVREPSFGCVNFHSSGAHDDMAHTDFTNSINVICKELNNTAWDQIDTFDKLRARGIEIEKEMFRESDGINTYKGFIFLIIILVFGLIKTNDFAKTPLFIKEFSKPLTLDYENDKNARSYKNLGLKDVRTFPLNGYEDLFNLSLAYNKFNMDDIILTLILIACVDDTTTLARSDIKTLRFLQDWALSIYNSYLRGNNIDKELHLLDGFYLKNKISSGGVADVFTLTKTIYYLREIYE